MYLTAGPSIYCVQKQRYVLSLFRDDPSRHTDILPRRAQKGFQTNSHSKASVPLTVVSIDRSASTESISLSANLIVRAGQILPSSRVQEDWNLGGFQVAAYLVFIKQISFEVSVCEKGSKWYHAVYFCGSLMPGHTLSEITRRT